MIDSFKMGNMSTFGSVFDVVNIFSVFKGLQPNAITKTKQLKQNKSLIWRLESSCPCVLWREREVDLTA